MKSRLTFLTLGAALILGATSLLQAQAADAPRERERGGERGGPGRGGPNIEMLAKELGLSADQKAKLEPILKAQGEKMQELRNLPQEERREKGRALREASQKEIEAVLTPEQAKKFAEMRANRGPRGEGRGERGERPKGEKPAGK